MVVQRLVAVVALASIWIFLSALIYARPSLADRIVQPLGLEDAEVFVQPEISQSHFRFIVIMLARSTRAPIGFEEVAQESQTYDGNQARVATGKRTVLIGLTVGQALDALVAADARYTWREQDGMLLIRPVDAWNQKANFLNEPVGGIEERQQRPIAIVRRLYDRRGLSIVSSSGGVIGNPTARTSDLDQGISVALPSPTVLDVLNAVVKSHGQLSWMVASVRAPEGLKNSCVYLITFDGQFTGIGADCGGGF